MRQRLCATICTMPPEFSSLVVVVVVAALAPILVGLLPVRFPLPQVVILLIAGILIGPSLLDWATPADVELLSSIGLGFLFLLAGYELDPAVLRHRAGIIAEKSWLLCVGLAAVLIAVAYALHIVNSPVVVTIALTTTALGTLLPILRDNDMLGGKFGNYMFAAGAVGELGPIIAMALFLGTRGSVGSAVVLVVFLVAALGIAMLPRLEESTRVGAIILNREHSTSQATLRIAVAMLFLLLLAASDLGFDNVLGAFVAGMILRRWSPGHIELLEAKLDAIGYGFFIPAFFIYSGMTLDIKSISENPLRLVVFLFVMLAIRGLPALFFYRNELPRIERVQLMFLTATALPLLIALTEVGVTKGTMNPAMQASVIGAGVLSVLLFPLIAVTLQRRKTVSATLAAQPSPLES